MEKLLKAIDNVKKGRSKIKKNGKGYFELVSVNKNCELIILLHEQLFIRNREPNFDALTCLQKKC